jgi:simple sugar transport system permease protein
MNTDSKRGKMDEKSSLSPLFKLFKRFYAYRPAGIFTVFVGLILFFSIFTGYRFLNRSNLIVMLKIGPELGIVALGVTMLMIAREFDLSIGSNVAFCGWINGFLYAMGLHPALAAFVVLIVGSLIGALNGLITVKFNIPSFITTLGTMMWWRGMVLIVTHGFPMSYLPGETHPLFYYALAGDVGGIPVQAIWFIVFTLLIWILLGEHRFGNWVQTTGDNKEAARAMGINTDRVKIICFVITGVLCGFTSVMQCTRSRGAYPQQALGWELDAIAAPVIGGTLLTGGVGTVIGTFIGVFLLHSVNTGLLIMRAEAYWFEALIGLIVIIGVIFNLAIERRRAK